MEDAGVLKITITDAVLSAATQHLKLVDPFVQFKYRDVEKRTQRDVPTIGTGRDKNRSQFDETFKIHVVSWDDEIVFQLRDGAKTKKSSLDNVVGEYRTNMREFIEDSGSEKWYKLMAQLEGWTAAKEAAQLSMTAVFTAQSKRQAEVYGKSKSEAEVRAFHENAAR